MTTLALVAYSDFICPYCYLGGAVMEDVLADYDATLEWRSYEIHPEIPEDGVPIEALNPRILNGIKASVTTISTRHNIPMQLPSRLPNSRRALLGAEFAREQGTAPEYHQGVFVAYFVEDRDIGRIPVLQEIAQEVGLDPDAFGRAVQDRVADPILDANAQDCQRKGITGVPTWIVDNTYSIVGALPPDHLRRSLDWALDRRQKPTPPA